MAAVVVMAMIFEVECVAAFVIVLIKIREQRAAVESSSREQQQRAAAESSSREQLQRAAAESSSSREQQ